MNKSHDPEQAPIASPSVAAFAASENLHLATVSVIDDEHSLQLITLGHHLPRTGEIFLLEDGQRCVVQNVVHSIKTGKHPETGESLYFTRAHVIAKLLPEDPPS